MSTESRRQAAKEYLRSGAAPIPVPGGEKNPGRAGWESLRISPDEVERYWTNGQNVGLLTGEPSGWLDDVDLDSDEAVKLAERFLPPTLTSGRGERPKSHWWYRCEGIKSGDYKDVDGSRLVEIRANGRQTIVPPSVHPSGDSYTWHRESGLSLLKIEATELEEACRELATAALIARHIPKHRQRGGGGRHDHALALSGFLLRPGRLDEETTLNLLSAVWEIADHPGEGEKREALRDLESIVSDTAQNLRSGQPVVGGPTLEGVHPGLVRQLCKYWGWERKDRDAEAKEDERNVPEPTPWPVLEEAALYGLVGDVVRAIEPHTEADPAAILANLLTASGNAADRGSYVRVGADRHHLNLFCALVGETSKARKGMSWGHVRELSHAVDAPWADDRVLSGLSSGEGLIHAVRDPVYGQNKNGEPTILDAGETDKRLLLVEGEFGKTLKVMTREGNILSAVIRSAWDGETLKTLTKNSPLKASGAHISIIGHITRGELLRLLSETDTENGFANRLLWIMVKRSKSLPFGGEWHTVNTAPLVKRLSEALEFAREAGEIRWGESARDLWREVYPNLSEGKPGLFGAATNRAEAQTLRLAALYAVMDLSRTVEEPHLQAALALWKYAEDSARFIFGDAGGDPVQDRILEALRDAPDGLTRTDLRDLFGRHKSRDRIDNALADLARQGKVRRESENTGGRPVEKWFLK